MGKRGAQAQNPEDSIKEYKEPSLLVQEIVTCKCTDWNPFLELRNKALLSMLTMTGLRISEILHLTTDQIFLDDPNDPGFLIIKNILVLKKRKKRILNEMGIKKDGVYKPLIDILTQYLEQIKPGKLFNISRWYAWQIIKNITGKWPHYYRSQKMSNLVNTLKGAADATAAIMKVEARTVSHYYKSSWRDHKEELI